jgi:hypothetical protein
VVPATKDPVEFNSAVILISSEPAGRPIYGYFIYRDVFGKRYRRFFAYTVSEPNGIVDVDLADWNYGR